MPNEPQFIDQEVKALKELVNKHLAEKSEKAREQAQTLTSELRAKYGVPR